MSDERFKLAVKLACELTREGVSIGNLQLALSRAGLALVPAADVPTPEERAVPERKHTTLEEVANLAREVLATNNEECLDALDLCEQLEVILQRDEKEKDG